VNNINTDLILSFHIDNNAFRGRFVRLSKSCQDIIKKHKVSKPVGGVLAESMSLACVLAGALKYDGLFTLQIQGDGPIPLTVADVTSDGKIRATCRYDQEKIDKAQKIRKTFGEIESAPHFFGAGQMAFTVDQGKNTDLYQGVVDLEGATLADCAKKYFQKSEQIETAIKIAVSDPDKDGDWKSSAIMLQKMPSTGGKKSPLSEEELEEAWRTAVIMLSSLTDKEMLNEKLSPAEALVRLYHSNELQLADMKKIEFGCRCSKEKVEQTIKGFNNEEVEQMKVNGKIEVTCQFCSQEYVFDEKDIKKIRK
jgi:molecular chaperone Hsp33